VSATDRRVALVTGGARGLGLAIAERLRDDGHLVVLADLDEAGAAASAETLGSRVDALPLDVTDDASVDAAVAQVVQRHGRLDVLVNNAGIISRGPAELIDSGVWLRELDVHLGGSMRCSRAAFAPLAASPAGAIVNLASVGSTFGLPLRLAYSTAKTGIVGLTRTLAAEWGRRGIRVNAVAPGYMDAPMLRSGLEQGVLDEGLLLQRTPLGRFGRADEVAAAVSFLVGPDASFVTGTVLEVDGGITIDGTFHCDDAAPA
jgi:NAD(P)-dependent dehydrogenase (short-subunit alcohol dehydrogenase family)